MQIVDIVFDCFTELTHRNTVNGFLFILSGIFTRTLYFHNGDYSMHLLQCTSKQVW